MDTFIKRPHVRISAIYTVVAALWIIISTILPLTLATGLVFVGVTALILYWLLRAELRPQALNSPTSLDNETPRAPSLAYPRQLYDHITDAIISSDMALRVTSWNRAAEQIYGWSAEEAVGKTIQEMMQIQFASEQEREGLQQHLLEYGSWKGESRQRREDGSELFVFGSITLVRDNQGNPEGFISIIHDITASKATEGALRRKTEEEREFQTYLKALHEITIELAQIDQADRLYRRTIELGLERLGFDRLALFLYDPEDEAALGTYGTDLQRQMTDEHQFRIYPLKSGIMMQAFYHVERFSFQEEAPLRSNLEVVDRGWNAAAVLWNGTQNLGWLVADNAVHHKPASKPLLDILALYSLTVGALLARTKTGEALRDSEEKFRLLVEEAPQAVIISDNTGQITLVNAEAEKIFGYSRAEIIGQPVELLVPEALRERHEQDRDSFIAGSRRRSYGMKPGLPAQRKDGTTFPADIHLSMVKTHDATLVMSFVQDITERQRAEQAIRESEARYRLLAENISDVVIRTTPDDRYVYVSPSCRAILGYEPEELIGHFIWEFVFPDDTATAQKSQRKLAESGTPPSMITYRRRHKDGHYLWVETIRQAVYSEETGELVEVVASLRDVTHRKRAEEALQSSEARFRSVIEAAPDYILLVDPQGKVLMANSMALRDSGYSQDEMIGHDIIEFLSLDSQRIFADELPRLLQTGSDRQDEQFVRKDGSLVPMERSASVIYAESGEPQSIILVQHDISQHIRAESTLRGALEREKELGDLKTRFISVASHEFRTPLATILSSSELLATYRHRMDERQIEHKLTGMTEQVKHLTDIIEDVLDLARMQTKRTEFRPDMQDLDELCRAVISEFQARSDIRHRIAYACDPTPTILTLDKRLMRQVINNLIANAIKYSPHGTTVDVRVQHIDGHVALTIHDEGIGIPEADVKHLFEPFHRAKNVGTIPGTGLGLSITKQAVEMHGGTIAVDSTEGTGTTFLISFPMPTNGNGN